MLCDQDHLLCNLGPFLSTLQIKETWVWFPGSKILKQELRKQKWRQERTNLCQWNPVTTYLHLEIMHIFFLDEIFFNCSENGNETTFKKLTVMENLNVTMISKKKEIISLILILLERREKKKMWAEKWDSWQWKPWDSETFSFVLPNEQGLSCLQEKVNLKSMMTSKWNLRGLLKLQAEAQQGHFLKWKFILG